MEYTNTKVLKKNKLNTIRLKNDFNLSVRRRDNKSVEKFWARSEENIDKIRDIMVAEEIYNTKIAHMEGESMFFELFHLYLATPGKYCVGLP